MSDIFSNCALVYKDYEQDSTQRERKSDNNNAAGVFSTENIAEGFYVLGRNVQDV